jgi:hypothetical protein
MGVSKSGWLVAQILQGYVQYVRDKQGESQAEEDMVMGLQVGAGVLKGLHGVYTNEVLGSNHRIV